MGDPGDGGPPSLHAGDRIAVVAPSGPADPALLERGCAVLRGLGLDVVVGKHALDHNPSGLTYLAGSDADRAADLQAAWCDPRIAAVFCARGGYGATRVLDHLDWDAMAGAAPKLLHGSSDITALHTAFGRRLSVPTSFGPMVASLIADADPEAVAHLREGVLGAGAAVRGTHALRGGRVSGVLTGGNLALLTSLIGTPYAPEPAAGRIAFLEDVDEAPYRVDRMLTQLLQSGWFDGVAGIVLGTWIGCGDLDAVFADRLTPIGAPILAGVPVGHGPRQLTLRLGAGAVLDADALVLSPSTGGGPERRTPPSGPGSEETL
ncbi:LD-carboxypeptidase [Actinomadura sp. DC4]|uniref:S66 peptidase family protein n=1 Tax=Actinomadura sp. DC4 TaxID=3055069 RepID=UPI0025B25A16|nr:LD-carboxypeptidase [Actinomadura sp. DC4]MDN3355339.1 LD-carboxypeptidase [Actinomadura sp. DC4]